MNIIFHRIIFTYIFLASSYSLGALPEDAQKLVNALPDKALTLELILVRGAQKTNSFKQVEAEKALVPVSELGAESFFATQIFANVRNFNDQSEPGNATINPTETDGFQYELGFQKYFSTGTATELSLGHNYTNLTILNSAFNVVPYETFWKLSVSQSLWKDSFGFASRRELKAGILASRAQGFKAQTSLEDWVTNIGGLFYEAWMSQKILFVADDSLNGRNQLLAATRLKEKRGTAEAPDRLQVESVQLLAKVRQANALQDLEDKWRNLVLSLKLPSEWMNVDPRQVPIQLDNPFPAAQAYCSEFRTKGVPKDENAKVKLTQNTAEASRLLTEAKKNKISPDLSLFGEYGSNAVDIDAGTSLSDGQKTEHPAWIVGLKFTIPIGFESEKSAYLKAYSDKIQSEALYDSTKDELRVNWMNSCSDLERKKSSVDFAKLALEKQKLREKLEDRRFRVGRVPVFNLIQAGDDVNDAEIFLAQQEVSYRMTAWKVIKIASGIPSALTKMASSLEKKASSLE